MSSNTFPSLSTVRTAELASAATKSLTTGPSVEAWPGLKALPVHPIFVWILEHSGEFVVPLAQVEQEHIERAMVLCRGDTELASERLGISRSTLFRRLAEYREKDLLRAVPIRE
ncbi:MAG TPA: helix-turn-helix domain-containing protein [Candidatus Binataceae bacterium]|nr:helix-turn-helix domain-containing protein [Candidatus Binataceae bacterium]